MNLFYTDIFAWGNKIYFKGYADGKRCSEIIKGFKPEFFYETQEDSDYKSLYGHNLKRHQYPSIKDAKNDIKYQKDMRNVYGNSDIVQQFILKNFKTVKYDASLLRVAYIDIEVESEHGFSSVEMATEKVNAISIVINGQTYVWALGEVKLSEYSVKCFSDEKALLEDFLETFVSLDLDILSGWNIRSFDIPYLVQRMENLGIDSRKLSEYNILKKREFTRKTKFGTEEKVLTYEIAGVNIIDYIELVQDMKYHPKRFESYSLHYVCEEVLQKGKLDYSEYGTLKEFYTKDFEKFIEYNIRDTKLVAELEEKLKLMQIVISLAYDAKVTLSSIFYATKIWETICYDFLYNNGIICQVKTIGEKFEKFEGAYVKVPVPGMYKNVVSLDATSLYPSIIRSFNISPETLIRDELHPVTFETINEIKVPGDFCLCANGAKFRKNQKGFIPILITKVFEERQIAKSQMIELQKRKEKEGDPDNSLQNEIDTLDIIQKVKKVLANSLYGCLGTPNFIFFDPLLPSAVTITGQLILKTAIQSTNQCLNAIAKNLEEKDYVLGADTDSVYVYLNDFIQPGIPNIPDFLDSFAKTHVQGEIQKSMDFVTKKLNSLENHIFFKRELIILNSFFVVRKNYALYVIDKEGVRLKNPEIIIKGLKAVKSDTPKFIRGKLKEIIEIILSKNNKDLLDFLKTLKVEFYSRPLEEIASPKTCNNLLKYYNPKTVYEKGTPNHVRGALIYNFELKARGIDHKYNSIREGEKIKFLPLKTPNEYGVAGQDSEWMGFINKIPNEFNLEEYVDKNAQWEKIVTNTVQAFTDAVGWSIVNRPSLFKPKA